MADYMQGTAIRIVDAFRVSGVLTDPTTVVYTITGPDGTSDTYTWPGAAEINHAGVGQFILTLTPPLDPGLYVYDVDATGAVVASRAGSFNVLPNAAPPVNLDWAVAGPCTSWVSSQDVWNCCGQPTIVVNGVECNVDFTSEAMAASQVLFELSGRRFSGNCTLTVRPCSAGCQCGWQIIEGSGHIIGPWDWGGSWGWYNNSWYCDGRPCGCLPLSRVKLSGYPVREITEVLIDGVIVDPDTYRLDERRYLTRVRDPADPGTVLTWPGCQHLDLPDTAAGTFSVTYRYGMDPPLIGIHAAAELACELYRACNNGSDCTLPSGVTRISRQGVVIERLAFAAWGVQNGIWRTGLTRVDAFLNMVSPGRLTRRPSVWSPDGAKFARPVGQ